MNERPDEVMVKETLTSFFAAMRDWELLCKKQDKLVESGKLDPDDSNAQLLGELQAIFGRFTLVSGTPRRGLSYTSPPQYDPIGEIILAVEVRADTATVRTDQTTGNPRLQCVYTLKKVDGQWKIEDNRQRVTSKRGLADWAL